ncbi:ABC transporter ATP-binding protein [Gammaproteobacteria bacterium]|nr:ABC transporter ATP-binding protein [Gammaproteobacteria bacterium]
MNILPLMIRNLNYSVNGNNILNNINILSDEKKITIIAGNNGSGKSTLLKILHGLIEIPDNTIRWGDYSIRSVKNNQTMVFQTPILLNRTTYENLNYVANKRNITKKNYVEKIIERLNIKNISNINTRYISGGERQKVSIAMAIIGDPKIIFLDEPTSQLDPAYKNEIENIINDLANFNVKIFMTSHDISQIKRIGKEIIFLDNGSVIYQNSVTKFFNQKHCSLINNYMNFG